MKWMKKLKNFLLLQKLRKQSELNSVMSNSFGFGGTNAALIFLKRYNYEFNER